MKKFKLGDKFTLEAKSDKGLSCKDCFFCDCDDFCKHIECTDFIFVEVEDNNHLQPIKLTVDILRESGWDVRDIYGSIPEHYISCSPNSIFLVHFYDDGTIEVDGNSSSKCIRLDNIQYVHELQQALLVMGLNDKLKPYKEK